MTVLFGIKKDGKIYLGADGATCAGIRKMPITVPYKYKIVPIKGSPNIYMASTGQVVNIDAIKNVDNLLEGKDDVSYHYLVKSLVPFMIKTISDLGLSERYDDMEYLGMTTIIMTKSNLFEIRGDGVVVEHSNVAIAGSGTTLAKTAYVALKDKIEDPKELVIEVIKKVIEKGDCYDYPIVVAGNDGTYEVIKK